MIRQALNFVKKVFFVAENSEDFSFSLTPLVRVRWVAMMMTEREPNREELLYLVLLESKTKDLINLLGSVASETRRKRNLNEDLSYERVDS